MANPANKIRNRELFQKRKRNPNQWTWGTLANHYGISRPRALAIYQAELTTNSSKEISTKKS